MAMRLPGIAPERPGEDDGRQALGLDALLDRPLDDALRRRHPPVLPGLLAIEGRQGGQVAVDEGLDRRQVQVADEDEGEVARVGEPVAEEGQRFLEVHLGDLLDRHGPEAGLVPLHGRAQGVREDGFRALGPVLEVGLELALEDVEDDRVGPRRGEGQVDELEEGLRVLGRGAARKALPRARRSTAGW